MSIFRKRRKATPLTIAAPVSGEIIDIADVPDPVFAGKHMGPGFAVAPVSGDFTSPIDGIVILVAPTLPRRRPARRQWGGGSGPRRRRHR